MGRLRLGALAARLAVALLIRQCQALQEAKPGLLELTTASFAPTLKALPEDRWVLMEFYAHWCPACQRFQPEYENLAAFFAQRGEQEPVVTVGRLDCADHADTCATFEVHGYPTMRLGLAADMAAASMDKLVEVQPASRHADSVLAWLGKQLDVKFDAAGLDAAALGNGGDGASGGSGSAGGAGEVRKASGRKTGGRKVDPGGTGGGAEVHERAVELTAEQLRQYGGGSTDLVDVEGATVTSWKYITASPLLLKGADARQALKDWVDLLADNHPVARCQAGAEKLQEALDEVWPDDREEPEAGLQDMAICPGTPFKAWRGCSGSAPDRRGYTCGLWQLFHTLAARLSDTPNSGAVWLAAVKGFVGSYFQCSECAKHFMQHATGEEARAVTTKRDACLWMWKAHNIVNRRLGSEEAADPSKGDPSAPHIQFPPRALCSKCRQAEGQGASKDETVPWDEDAIYTFLLSFYSGQPAASGVAGGALVNGAAGRKRSSWMDAGLVLALVAALVYATLRGSAQYALKKSDSRSL